MKICIIGAGNAGCAHAFKLKELGHEIRLIKTSHRMHEDYFKYISNKGSITAIDETNGDLESTQQIDLISRDHITGIKGADVVLVMTQTLQHEDIAKRITPYFEERQIVIVIPGNLGSVFFRKKAKNNVLIGEGESTPFDARIEDDNKVHILFKNVRNALSFLPSCRKEEGLSVARNIINTYGHSRCNVIESALHNPNLIVHTVGTIMSASRIEMSKGEFWMYRESFSPAIWNLVSLLDEEKNSVLEAFGCERLSYLEACKFRNEEDLRQDGLKVFQSYAKHGGPKGPSSLNTRFLYEDIPNGLCLLSSLAKKADIDTPICDALILLANALMKTNFWKAARTKERLGFSNWTVADIINYVNTLENSEKLY